jgi:D-xylose transport system substrate-binding protein
MIAVAGVAILPLVLTACGGQQRWRTGILAAAASRRQGQVGVILPDAATSPRWENNDRPLWTQPSRRPATRDHPERDEGREQVRHAVRRDDQPGVRVLMIVNLDSDSRRACEKKAQDAGIKSIDYDRLTLGGRPTTTCRSTTSGRQADG